MASLGKVTVEVEVEKLDEYKQLIEEYDYLLYFFCNADFGPAHHDVVRRINNNFTASTGKDVPEDFTYE